MRSLEISNEQLGSYCWGPLTGCSNKKNAVKRAYLRRVMSAWTRGNSKGSARRLVGVGYRICSDPGYMRDRHLFSPPHRRNVYFMETRFNTQNINVTWMSLRLPETDAQNLAQAQATAAPRSFDTESRTLP